MNRLGVFLTGMIVGGLAVFGSERFHVLRAYDGFHLVPKHRPTFEETYVDARNFGVAEWTKHTELAAALVEARKGYLLENAASQEVQRNLPGLFDQPPAGN